MNKNIRLFITLLVCMYFWYYAKTYTQWHFIDNANLIFHEAGHTIFFFLGKFVQVAMGSGTQIIIPLLISLYFFFNNKKIEGAVTLLWLGQNFLNVSIYVGDAIGMQLELLGGDGVLHDWNYLLSVSGLLNYTSTISGLLYGIGVLMIFIGTILSLWFVWENN